MVTSSVDAAQDRDSLTTTNTSGERAVLTEASHAMIDIFNRNIESYTERNENFLKLLLHMAQKHKQQKEELKMKKNV